MNNVIFREYDIRGVVDSDFDADFAHHLGRAYITYLFQEKGLKNPKICIGHDARLSSPQLVKSLSRGMAESGAQVLLLGLVTTPVTYFSTFSVPDVAGAIMVTGSHNPPEYNGFKISVGKSTIFGAEIKKLETIINSGDYVSGDGSESTYDIFPEYVARYEREFGKLPKVPVVVDCGNGAAGSILRRLYSAVGVSPTILFEEPDGTFPNHHPDPTVEENLTDLVAAVKKENALIGIGFDGDADRIGVVGRNGRMFYGDELMALVSRDILKDKPGEKIIGDVKCSDRLYHDVAKYGGKPIMWKTGHSLIKEKIKVEKAPFGGELSGHIFFADRNYGFDDALYAGLRIIEILGKTGKSIEDLLADFPPAFNTPEIRIDTTEEKKHQIVDKLKESFASEKPGISVNLIDGIRVSYPFGWALARASNTQPVLVLRFEADSQEHLNQIKKEFEDIVQPLLK
ncbi:MAG: phosphomannomutase/phosphoglucomutase [Bdellovibrionaceae bacterium]|nr:phosphomannomutase/phosphoglucomutase [Bdellovibrionales bacterium]MCB9085442.1 phosphomannomutase/phosphoglucomutase [Pseudobdellovibrionaceae bacterium]